MKSKNKVPKLSRVYVKEDHKVTSQFVIESDFFLTKETRPSFPIPLARDPDVNVSPGQYDIKPLSPLPAVEVQPFVSKVPKCVEVKRSPRPEVKFSLENEEAAWVERAGTHFPDEERNTFKYMTVSKSTDALYNIKNNTIQEQIQSSSKAGASSTFVSECERFPDPIIFYNDRKKVKLQHIARTPHKDKGSLLGSQYNGDVTDLIFTKTTLQRDSEKWQRDFDRMSAAFQSKAKRIEPLPDDPWSANATLGPDNTSWSKRGVPFTAQLYEGRGALYPEQIRATLYPRPHTSPSPSTLSSYSSSSSSSVRSRLSSNASSTMSINDYHVQLCEEHLSFENIKKNCKWYCLTEADRKKVMTEKQGLQKYLLGL
jgi:hypothetical protein